MNVICFCGMFQDANEKKKKNQNTIFKTLGPLYQRIGSDLAATGTVSLFSLLLC